MGSLDFKVGVIDASFKIEGKNYIISKKENV